MNDFRKVNSQSSGLFIVFIHSIAFAVAATTSSGISPGIGAASESIINTISYSRTAYTSSGNRSTRESSTSDPNSSVSSISNITEKTRTPFLPADTTVLPIAAASTTAQKTLTAPKPQPITGINLVNVDFRFTLVWYPVVLPNKTGNSTNILYRVSARVRNMYTRETERHTFNATSVPLLSIAPDFPGKEGTTTFTVEAIVDEIAIGKGRKKFRGFDSYRRLPGVLPIIFGCWNC